VNPSNVILHLTPKWSAKVMEDPRREPLCCASPITEGGVPTGLWSVLLALPTNTPYPFTISCPARPRRNARRDV
jgi:hypothetical protein